MKAKDLLRWIGEGISKRMGLFDGDAELYELGGVYGRR
jgi:hypothetical protein